MTYTYSTVRTDHVNIASHHPCVNAELTAVKSIEKSLPSECNI